MIQNARFDAGFRPIRVYPAVSDYTQFQTELTPKNPEPIPGQLLDKFDDKAPHCSNAVVAIRVRLLDSV